jgi:RNA 3'-terminal phosphate cyclase
VPEPHPRGHAHPGVVDQHVQAIQVISGGAYRRGDRVRVGGIRRHEPGSRSQHLPGVLAKAAIAPGDHYPRAFAQEPPGDG